MANTLSKAHRSLSALLLAEMLVLSVPPDAVAQGNNPIIPLPRIPLTQATVVGQGYAYSVGSIRASAVDTSGVQSKNSTGIEYDLKYVDDYSELARELSISASASYGAGGAGGSARANFLSSSTMSRRSAYVLVRMTVETRTESISEFSLTAPAAAAAPNGKIGFIQTYGDSFVSAITHGGELFALMQFNASSAAEAQSLRVSVKANVGAFAGGMTMEQKVRALTVGKNVSVRYAQTGGATGQAAPPVPGAAVAPAVDLGGGVITLTPEQLISRMREFPKEVRDFPAQTKPLFGELKDYGVVSNWPSNVDRPVPSSLSQRLSSVVRAYLLVREELATVSDALAESSYQPAVSMYSASERRPYLTYIEEQLQALLLRVAQNPDETAPLHVVAFDQYRAELVLSLPTSVWRGNAGDQCDVTEPDTERVARCLFGRAAKWKFERWPTVRSSAAHRGHQGEGGNLRVPPPTRYTPNWLSTVHIPCGTNVNDFAQRMCGKTSDDDGRIVVVSGVPNATFSGNRCGYTAVNIACVELEKPASELGGLVPVPVPTTATLSPGPIQLQNEGSGARAVFTVTPNCAPSFGAYDVTVNRAGGPALVEKGYWRAATKEALRATHPIPTGLANVKAAEVSVRLRSAYCETPFDAASAQAELARTRSLTRAFDAARATQELRRILQVK